jgi:hypothetical protein
LHALIKRATSTTTRSDAIPPPIGSFSRHALRLCTSVRPSMRINSQLAQTRIPTGVAAKWRMSRWIPRLWCPLAQMLHGRERRRLDQVDHHRSGQDGNAPASDMRRSVLSADEQVCGASQAGPQSRQIDHSTPWFKRCVSLSVFGKGSASLQLSRTEKAFSP